MKTNLLLACCIFSLCTKGFSQGHWKLITAINSSSPLIYGMDVSFINNSVGFFASGYNDIFKTTDKGETWDSISHIQNSTLRSLEFINDSIGFAGTLSGSTSQAGAMFKTTDGGYSWLQLTNMQMSIYDGICGIAKYSNSLVAVGTFDGPPWFYRTDDFGANWNKADLSLLASGLVDCQMLSSDTILVSGTADSANNHCATILKSFDGGNTWQRVFLASQPNTYMWKLFIRSSGKGLASIQNPVNDTLKVAVTNDFGDTWQEINVSPNNPDGLWLAGVCFLNDTLGWVSSEYGGLTFETRDGGFTWDSIPLVSGLNRFAVLDSATVIGPGIYNFAGAVYKYDQSPVGMPVNGSGKKYEMNTLKVYPDPVKSYLNIEATAGLNTLGRMRIVDQKGIEVKEITRQFFKKGTTLMKEKISLPPGIYYLLWLTNNMFSSQKFVVVK